MIRVHISEKIELVSPPLTRLVVQRQRFVISVIFFGDPGRHPGPLLSLVTPTLLLFLVFGKESTTENHWKAGGDCLGIGGLSKGVLFVPDNSEALLS